MNMNRVEEILGQPYRRVLVPDAESGVVSATIPEFPGCIAEGNSTAEALDNLERTARDWIASLLSRDIAVPPPVEGRDYSGRFPLRLPRSLHERTAVLAEEEGVSLNTFIVTTLAERVGVRYAEARVENFLRRAIQQLRGPRIVRITGILEEAGTQSDYTIGPVSEAASSGWGNQLSSPTSQAGGVLTQSR